MHDQLHRCGRQILRYERRARCVAVYTRCLSTHVTPHTANENASTSVNFSWSDKRLTQDLLEIDWKNAVGTSYTGLSPLLKRMHYLRAKWTDSDSNDLSSLDALNITPKERRDLRKYAQSCNVDERTLLQWYQISVLPSCSAIYEALNKLPSMVLPQYLFTLAFDRINSDECIAAALHLLLKYSNRVGTSALLDLCGVGVNQALQRNMAAFVPQFVKHAVIRLHERLHVQGESMTDSLKGAIERYSLTLLNFSSHPLFASEALLALYETTGPPESWCDAYWNFLFHVDILRAGPAYHAQLLRLTDAAGVELHPLWLFNLMRYNCKARNVELAQQYYEDWLNHPHHNPILVPLARASIARAIRTRERSEQLPALAYEPDFSTQRAPGTDDQVRKPTPRDPRAYVDIYSDVDRVTHSSDLTGQERVLTEPFVEDALPTPFIEDDSSSREKVSAISAVPVNKIENSASMAPVKQAEEGYIGRSRLQTEIVFKTITMQRMASEGKTQNALALFDSVPMQHRDEAIIDVAVTILANLQQWDDIEGVFLQMHQAGAKIPMLPINTYLRFLSTYARAESDRIWRFWIEAPIKLGIRWNQWSLSNLLRTAYRIESYRTPSEPNAIFQAKPPQQINWLQNTSAARTALMQFKEILAINHPWINTSQTWDGILEPAKHELSDEDLCPQISRWNNVALDQLNFHLYAQLLIEVEDEEVSSNELTQVLEWMRAADIKPHYDTVVLLLHKIGVVDPPYSIENIVEMFRRKPTQIDEEDGDASNFSGHQAKVRQWLIEWLGEEAVPTWDQMMQYHFQTSRIAARPSIESRS